MATKMIVIAVCFGLAGSLLFMFSSMSGCTANDAASSGDSLKIVEKRDHSGRLMIYTRTVAGTFDGPYVWDEGVGRTEGCYSNGFLVGEWSVWRRNGVLQSKILYGLDRSKKQEVILDATYFAGDGKPMCSVSNGVGIVPMFGMGDDIIGFSSVGVAESYTIQYESATGPRRAGAKVAENAPITGQFYKSDTLPQLQYLCQHRNTNTIALEIRWDRGSGAVMEVYEHRLGHQPSRWTLDIRGHVIMMEGERPTFLNGDPIIVPTLNKGVLHFEHILVYSNRTTYLTSISATILEVNHENSK